MANQTEQLAEGVRVDYAQRNNAKTGTPEAVMQLKEEQSGRVLFETKALYGGMPSVNEEGRFERQKLGGIDFSEDNPDRNKMINDLMAGKSLTVDAYAVSSKRQNFYGFVPAELSLKQGANAKILDVKPDYESPDRQPYTKDEMQAIAKAMQVLSAEEAEWKQQGGSTKTAGTSGRSYARQSKSAQTESNEPHHIIEPTGDVKKDTSAYFAVIEEEIKSGKRKTSDFNVDEQRAQAAANGKLCIVVNGDIRDMADLERYIRETKTEKPTARNRDRALFNVKGVYFMQEMDRDENGNLDPDKNLGKVYQTEHSSRCNRFDSAVTTDRDNGNMVVERLMSNGRPMPNNLDAAVSVQPFMRMINEIKHDAPRLMHVPFQQMDGFHKTKDNPEGERVSVFEIDLQRERDLYLSQRTYYGKDASGQMVEKKSRNYEISDFADAVYKPKGDALEAMTIGEAMNNMTKNLYMERQSQRQGSRYAEYRDEEPESRYKSRYADTDASDSRYNSRYENTSALYAKNQYNDGQAKEEPAENKKTVSGKTDAIVDRYAESLPDDFEKIAANASAPPPNMYDNVFSDYELPSGSSDMSTDYSDSVPF